VLVLTRKPQQSVMIGDDVEVTVIAVQGDKVRLGINAPTEIPVFRTEIYLEIAREREREQRKRTDVGSDAEQTRSGRDEPGD
jgi:carbon storage regulator